MNTPSHHGADAGAPDASLWTRKLAALLHDPPEKAYDFGPHHVHRAETHAASFGVSDVWKSLTGQPDWSAAAADRFVFPSGTRLGANLGEKQHPCFIHPMMGRSTAATLPTGALQFPSQADAEEWIGSVRPDWQATHPTELFHWVWRHWSVYAAEHAQGRGRGAEILPYLPADTRITDGSIWHHCAIVSALEATRAGNLPRAPLRPAFLIFQVGPVQEFISQARSTRDMWSGSYLLSWLTMHAIKAVADACGPDCLIFPSLKGQPIYDFLNQAMLGLERHFQDPNSHGPVLVPGIPNRFLAIVRDDFDAEAVAVRAFQEEWRRIANQCWKWLADRRLETGPHGQRLWEDQVSRHWQITWQLWPWTPAADALKRMEHLGIGHDMPIALGQKVARAIPEQHKDDRCYHAGQLDPGWAWSAQYQLCQHALDARRAVRDFQGLPTNTQRKTGHRDALSGREEAVVQAADLENAARRNQDLRHLFRHFEPMGAANVIKRVWHKAYLARLEEAGHPVARPLKRARESFDSVPSVAAGAFAQRLYELAEANGPLRERWMTFAAAASKARDAFPELIAPWHESSEASWHHRTDQSVYLPSIWQRERARMAEDGKPFHSLEARKSLEEAEQALNSLLAAAKRRPSSYYAVLALDGDQVGKWLSGEKSPAIKDVISADATDYFRKNIPADANVDVEKWLASPRPISPSWHLQFSEALAHFGLHAARRIVEDIHHGQLIFSGGDDVLAMVPADEAIACATDLRAAFQGDRKAMSPECQKHFRQDAPKGFLWLSQPDRGEPSWPLLVPGPRMSVSVGISIGHVKEPLQDMVDEARDAERRAKAAPARKARGGDGWENADGFGRDAIAVTIFKRSGESIRWGAKFGSAAFPLLQYLKAHYRPSWDNPEAETPISGKFPYRLAEILGQYGHASPMDDAMLGIAKAELDFVITRQTSSSDPESPEAFDRRSLSEHSRKYMEELRAFAHELPGGNQEPQRIHVPRSIGEFVNVFLMEAFIRRQAD